MPATNVLSDIDGTFYVLPFGFNIENDYWRIGSMIILFKIKLGMKSLLPVQLLIVTLVLSSCGSIPTESENHAEYNALGDPKAALTYNTAFPIASAAEAIVRGDAAMVKGDTDRALFEYIRALEKEGADGETLYKIGRVHLSRGDNKRAKLAFMLALKEIPEHAGALLEVGLLQMQSREYDAARQTLEHALQLAPNSPKALNALGVLEDMQKNFQQAQIHYRKAIALGGDTPLYLNNLGYSRYLAGDQAGAERAFNDALRLRPNHTRAWRNLGLVYAKTERYQEALDAFGKIEAEHQAYNDVGYVAMVSGRYDDAQKFFEEAMRISPTYYELALQNAKRLELVRERENTHE